MNDASFLDQLISYSLENLKSLECAPNVEFNMPNDMLIQESNEVMSKLVRDGDDAREYYDEDDKK